MLSEAGGSAQEITELRAELGLDDSLVTQYGRYLLRLAQADLGTSLFTQRSVVDTIGEQLLSTIELAIAAIVIATTLGVALGVIAAAKHGTWLDALVMAISVSGISIPIFWSALLLIWLFALILGWLPATGKGGVGHLILPASVLGFASAGAVTRLVRAGLLDVMEQDYVSTARAKGLAEHTILFRHTLKNAFIPVISIIGLQFGFLLGGTVVIETIFSRPGLGHLLVNAILWKDLPLVQGIVLLVALIYTLVNLATDVAYAYLDPRIHYG
jgi:ABC-type dipeptide/oligopeptide/nickel transport system permease component